MLSPESKKRMRRTASFFQDMNKKNSELTRVIKRGREPLHKYVSNLMKSPNSPLTKRIKSYGLSGAKYSPPKKNSPLTKRAKELGLNKAKYSPNALKRRHKELGPINNNSAFNNLVKNLGFNKPKSTKK